MILGTAVIVILQTLLPLLSLVTTETPGTMHTERSPSTLHAALLVKVSEAGQGAGETVKATIRRKLMKLLLQDPQPDSAEAGNASSLLLKGETRHAMPRKFQSPPALLTRLNCLYSTEKLIKCYIYK